MAKRSPLRRKATAPPARDSVRSMGSAERLPGMSRLATAAAARAPSAADASVRIT